MSNRAQLVIIPLVSENIFDVAVLVTAGGFLNALRATLTHKSPEPQQEVSGLASLAVDAKVVVWLANLHV